MKRTKLLFTILGAIILAIIAYFLFTAIYNATKQAFFIEISNAVIGIIFGGVVTVLLLFQQTSSEEAREKNVELFKVKHELFNNFFDVLWSAWEDEILEEDEVKQIMRLLKRISLFLDDKTTEELSALVLQLLEVNYSKKYQEDKIEEIETIFMEITMLLRYDLGIRTSRRGNKESANIMNIGMKTFKFYKEQVKEQ